MVTYIHVQLTWNLDGFLHRVINAPRPGIGILEDFKALVLDTLLVSTDPEVGINHGSNGCLLDKILFWI